LDLFNDGKQLSLRMLFLSDPVNAVQMKQVLGKGRRSKYFSDQLCGNDWFFKIRFR